MIFYSSKIPELQSAVKKRQYDERWDHVCNAAELAVVSFLLGRRICFSGGQSASVVDQQPHDVGVVDNRRQLERSYVVLNRPFLTVRLHEILSEPSSSVNMFVVVVHLSLVFADFSCVKEWENYRRALHRAHCEHIPHTRGQQPQTGWSGHPDYWIWNIFAAVKHRNLVPKAIQLTISPKETQPQHAIRWSAFRIMIQITRLLSSLTRKLYSQKISSKHIHNLLVYPVN